jgi:hypothetical protein
MFPNVLKNVSIFNMSLRRVKRANISVHATAARYVSERNTAICYGPTYSDLDYIDLKSSDRKEDARVSQIDW